MLTLDDRLTNIETSYVDEDNLPLIVTMPYQLQQPNNVVSGISAQFVDNQYVIRYSYVGVPSYSYVHSNYTSYAYTYSYVGAAYDTIMSTIETNEEIVAASLTDLDDRLTNIENEYLTHLDLQSYINNVHLSGDSRPLGDDGFQLTLSYRCGANNLTRVNQFNIPKMTDREYGVAKTLISVRSIDEREGIYPVAITKTGHLAYYNSISNVNISAVNGGNLTKKYVSSVSLNPIRVGNVTNYNFTVTYMLLPSYLGSYSYYFAHSGSGSSGNSGYEIYFGKTTYTVNANGVAQNSTIIDARTFTISKASNTSYGVIKTYHPTQSSLVNINESTNVENRWYGVTATVDGKLAVNVPLDMSKQNKLIAGHDIEIVDLLPEGYVLLDYIECTGTQYIDTGIILSNATDDVELVFQTDGRASNNIFGSRTTTTSKVYAVDITNSMYRTGWENTSVESTTPVDTNKHTLKIDHNGGLFIIDDETIAERNNSTVATVASAYLFAIRRANNSTMYYGNAVKIFDYKVWRNNELIQHLVPARNIETDAPGMYDVVGQQFLENVNTNSQNDFITGNEVDMSQTINFVNNEGFITSADLPVPSDDNPLMDDVASPGVSDDYSRKDHVHPSDTTKQHVLKAGSSVEIIKNVVQIEYLQSNGNQRIDTGILLEDTDTINARVMFNPKSGDNPAFGSKGTTSGSSGTGLWFELYSNATLYARFGSNASASTTGTTSTQYDIELKKNSLSVNGSEVAQPGYSSMPTNILHIFGTYFYATSSFTGFTGRIYSFTVTDKFGHKKLDLIPVKIGTTGYMFDMVTGRLLANAGTGNFTLGTNVDDQPHDLISFINDNDFFTSSDADSKADKVTNATAGNFAALDSTGNLVDSQHKHDDYLTNIGLNGKYLSYEQANVTQNITIPFATVSEKVVRNYLSTDNTTVTNDPVINVSSDNKDIWLWRVRSGDTGTQTSTDKVYGFGAKYLGSGTGNNNSWACYADNGNGTQIKALEMKQSGDLYAYAPIRWANSNALPEDTAPLYFLTIDSFASGGKTKWTSKNTLITSLGLPSYVRNIGNNGNYLSYVINGETKNIIVAYADNANKVYTIAKTNNNTYYLTFVDSNNTTKASESIYTYNYLRVNPSLCSLTAGLAGASSAHTTPRISVVNNKGEIGLHTDTNRGIYDFSQTKWLIAYNNNYTYTFLGIGNVGIGTTATTGPIAKLDVNGNIRATSEITSDTYVRAKGNDIYAGSSSGSQCHMQYDNTLKCIKFIFD